MGSTHSGSSYMSIEARMAVVDHLLRKRIGSIGERPSKVALLRRQALPIFFAGKYFDGKFFDTHATDKIDENFPVENFPLYGITIIECTSMHIPYTGCTPVLVLAGHCLGKFGKEINCT